MIEWFEDLAIGMRFNSVAVQISEDEIKQFAAKYDPQPFYLDDEAARQTIFRGSSSGWHTAAVAMRLAVETRPFGPHLLVAFYGIEFLDLFRGASSHRQADDCGVRRGRARRRSPRH